MFKKVSKIAGLCCLVLALVVGTNYLMAAAPYPSQGTSVSSWADFVVSSPFAQNFVIDKPRVWLPASGGSEVTVASLVGLGGGTPVPTEVNSSEIGGFLMDADAESFSVLMPIPSDMDLSKDIRVRGLFSNSEAAGTGTGDITFTYEIMVTGTTAISVANDAVDTNGAAVVDLAANVLTWSSYDTITGGTISATPGEDFLIIKGAVDLTTIANMTVYGYQLEYHRKFLGADGSF